MFDLLGCPFCGEKPTHHHTDNPVSSWWIECRNIKCRVEPSVWGGSIIDIAEKWNRRSDLAPVLPPPGMVLVPRLVLTRIKLASEIARIGKLDPLAEYLDEITALAQLKEGA